MNTTTRIPAVTSKIYKSTNPDISKVLANGVQDWDPIYMADYKHAPDCTKDDVEVGDVLELRDANIPGKGTDGSLGCFIRDVDGYRKLENISFGWYVLSEQEL